MDEKFTMSDREKLLGALMDVLGEEGCGVSCEEARANIREYARMGFGLS